MYDTVEELLCRQPFEPFEIHLSNGNSYPVRHPEFAQISKLKIVIGIPETEQIVVCFLLHIAEIRMLPKKR
jgi:hypothetical protein